MIFNKIHIKAVLLLLCGFLCTKGFAQGLTPRQESARRDAITLLSYDKPYSRSGLIYELEFQGYLYTDAEAAVDDININWSNQAKNMAKNYLRLDAFSKSGLIHKLEEDGFSHEEATFGVSCCGANWKEQAKRMASDFSQSYAITREDVIKHLEEKGFTHDQAVYGANKNGFRDDNNVFSKIKNTFKKSDDKDDD